MKTRKALTRELVEMKAKGLSYKAIGEYLGVTRQRAQQIFTPSKEVMLQIANRARGMCEECGQFDQFGHFAHREYIFEKMADPDNFRYLCCACHRKIDGNHSNCLNCGKHIRSGRKFCSRLCRRAYCSVTTKCSSCGKIFTLAPNQKIRLTLSKSGLIFCSKKCQGLYVAKHFGFGVHPENAGRRKNSRYGVKIPEIIMRLNSGESLGSIMQNMGIPQGNHSYLRGLILKYKSL